MSKIATVAVTIALLAGLTACQRKTAPAADTLDDDLVNQVAAAGPAPAVALGKQIVVDPTLAGRPVAPAAVAPAPAPDVAMAPAVSGKQGCAFAYDVAWSRKLPAELALFPGARMVEAAGSDAPGCKRRIISFTAPAPVAGVVDFYRTRVTRAGYSVEHEVQQGSDILGGTRGDAAYYISVRPAGVNAMVDLISNGG